LLTQSSKKLWLMVKLVKKDTVVEQEQEEKAEKAILNAVN